MEIQTRETDQGTEIRVYTDKKVALAVRYGEEERIYLPEVKTGGSTYYTGSPTDLTQFSDGYKVVHEGEVDDIQVIS